MLENAKTILSMIDDRDHSNAITTAAAIFDNLDLTANHESSWLYIEPILSFSSLALIFINVAFFVKGLSLNNIHGASIYALSAVTSCTALTFLSLNRNADHAEKNALFNELLPYLDKDQAMTKVITNDNLYLLEVLLKNGAGANVCASKALEFKNTKAFDICTKYNTNSNPLDKLPSAEHGTDSTSSYQAQIEPHHVDALETCSTPHGAIHQEL